MKKAVLVTGLVMAVCAGLALAADPDTVTREAWRSVVSTNGVRVATNGTVNTVASTNTPAFAGQWLFGGAGVGTTGVWVARGLTTNDWVQLKP
jgi:multisubunit Na+/H+ antiporter MnhG subunit